MSVESVREKWRTDQPVSAAWLSTTDGLIAETVAHSGFDVVVLDMQHGMAIGPDRAAAWLQAVGNADVAALIRVPWNEPVHVQYMLDAGADGIIVPLVASPADAAKAAGSCRYPPLGFRSWGPNRARFRAGADYRSWANEQVLCLALVEHIDAVRKIEEIVQTPGLDGVFIGPNDLGFSMGLPPGNHDERHDAACRRVANVSRAAGKIVGFYGGGGPPEAAHRMAQGFNFCPIASDVGLIRDGATTVIREFLSNSA